MWKFVRDHPIATCSMIVGAAINVASRVNDAYTLINAGLHPSAWEAIGAAIFFISVIALLYRWDMESGTGAGTGTATRAESKAKGPPDKPREVEQIFEQDEREIAQRIFFASESLTTRPNLNATDPYIDLQFGFINASVFSLAFRRVEGPIKYVGEIPQAEPKAINSDLIIGHGKYGLLTVRQHLSSAMAANILSRLPGASEQERRLDTGNFAVWFSFTNKRGEGREVRIAGGNAGHEIAAGIPPSAAEQTKEAEKPNFLAQAGVYAGSVEPFRLPKFQAKFARSGASARIFIEHVHFVGEWGIGWSGRKKIIIQEISNFVRGQSVKVALASPYRAKDQFSKRGWVWGPSEVVSEDNDYLILTHGYYRGCVTVAFENGLEERCYFIMKTGTERGDDAKDDLPRVTGAQMFDFIAEWEADDA